MEKQTAAEITISDLLKDPFEQYSEHKEEDVSSTTKQQKTDEGDLRDVSNKTNLLQDDEEKLQKYVDKLKVKLTKNLSVTWKEFKSIWKNVIAPAVKTEYTGLHLSSFMKNDTLHGKAENPLVISQTPGKVSVIVATPLLTYFGGIRSIKNDFIYSWSSDETLKDFFENIWDWVQKAYTLNMREINLVVASIGKVKYILDHIENIRANTGSIIDVAKGLDSINAVLNSKPVFYYPLYTITERSKNSLYLIKRKQNENIENISFKVKAVSTRSAYEALVNFKKVCKELGEINVFEALNILSRLENTLSPIALKIMEIKRIVSSVLKNIPPEILNDPQKLTDYLYKHSKALLMGIKKMIFNVIKVLNGEVLYRIEEPRFEGKYAPEELSLKTQGDANKDLYALFEEIREIINEVNALINLSTKKAINDLIELGKKESTILLAANSKGALFQLLSDKFRKNHFYTLDEAIIDFGDKYEEKDIAKSFYAANIQLLDEINGSINYNPDELVLVTDNNAVKFM